VIRLGFQHTFVSSLCHHRSRRSLHHCLPTALSLVAQSFVSPVSIFILLQLSARSCFLFQKGGSFSCQLLHHTLLEKGIKGFNLLGGVLQLLGKVIYIILYIRFFN